MYKLSFHGATVRWASTSVTDVTQCSTSLHHICATCTILSKFLALRLCVCHKLIFASLQVSSLHRQPVAIAFSLCLFGFFALPLIPACMELGVEVTYPVAEATSSGLLWSAVYVCQSIRFKLCTDAR